LRTFGNSSGDRVGQLFGEPVDDVIHFVSSSRRRAGIRGVSQSKLLN
jgi:hypothetical protein